MGDGGEESKGKKIFTILMKYCFSHIGLFLLVGGYCVGGAYLFQHIEMQLVQDSLESNVNKSRQIETDRTNLADQLWMYKWSVDYNNTVDKLLADYQSNVADAIQNYGYGGSPTTIDELKNPWAFPSALLFTISIVTTIGYGQVVPKTDSGQLTVILYALVGVPLMLMFLANIGEVMARFFRLAYGRGCCYFCWKKRKQNYELNRQRIRDIREGRVAKNAWMNDAVLDEHGRPKFAGGDEKKVLDEDLTQSRRRLHARSRSNSPADGRSHSNSGRDDLHKVESGDVARKDTDPADEFNSYNIWEDIEDPDDDVINVPISLTLVIIAAYLFVGAVLFAAWNGWTWITGAYFSFVTLSTIGFGDLIPGWDEVGTTVGNVKMAVSCFYIVFGLAVVSMSFNLMMEEMIAKFQWLGRKLGIIDDPNAKKNLSDDKRPLVDNEVENDKNAVKDLRNEPKSGRPKTGMANAPNAFQNEAFEGTNDEINHAKTAAADSVTSHV